MDIKQEVREFVEGFFLMQYLAKGDHETVYQENDFDKIEKTGLELTSPKIKYNSSGLFILTLTFNENFIALRFVPSISLYHLSNRMYVQTLKEQFDLNRISSDNRIINAQFKYESCERFLTWLFEQISTDKPYVDSVTANKLFANIYGTSVLHSKSIVKVPSDSKIL